MPIFSGVATPGSSMPRAVKTPAVIAVWHVYLVRCRDGSLYTGITNNLERRLKQHNAGTASRYTRSRLPAKLAYREVQLDRSTALKREAAIKRLTRREKLALIRSTRSAKSKSDRTGVRPLAAG